MEIQGFIDKWNGQPCEVEDPSNRDQCMDLAFAWCDFIGLNRIAIRNLTAKDVWVYNTGMDAVTNPRPGDFVIWGTLVGPAGHIAIFVEGTATSFTSFDQNWEGKQYCMLAKHTNYGVLGFLRPKAENVTKGDIMNLNDARIIFHGVGGFNGEDGKPNALKGEIDDTIKQYVGRSAQEILEKCYESPDATNWREVRLPHIYSEASRLAVELQTANDQINAGKGGSTLNDTEVLAYLTNKLTGK